MLYCRCHLSYHLHHSSQCIHGVLAEISERRHMSFGNNYDMDRPVRTGVVKREHIIGFQNNLDRCIPGNRLITVEVVH